MRGSTGFSRTDSESPKRRIGLVLDVDGEELYHEVTSGAPNFEVAERDGDPSFAESGHPS